MLPAYVALPLMYTVPDISWFQAYFEAMSGIDDHRRNRAQWS